jgi:hypothetical protein
MSEMIEGISNTLIKKQGDYSLNLMGEKGGIESILSVPENASETTLALIGHPHSLHGGTLNNKVVTTLSRSLIDCNISTLRFNFRGVGKSEGEFDKGIGESLDALKFIKRLREETTISKILLFGFSFGAYVMYRVACQTEVSLLVSVAPAVNHGDFSEFQKVPTPWHVLVAGADEIVPTDDVLGWHETVSPSPVLSVFDGASHFFHGKLVELKSRVKDIITHG